MAPLAFLTLASCSNPCSRPAPIEGVDLGRAGGGLALSGGKDDGSVFEHAVEATPEISSIVGAALDRLKDLPQLRDGEGGWNQLEGDGGVVELALDALHSSDFKISLPTGERS